MRCQCGCMSEVRCKWFANGQAHAIAVLPPCALFKSTMVNLLFWFWLIQVVLKKMLSNGHLFIFIVNISPFTVVFQLHVNLSVWYASGLRGHVVPIIAGALETDVELQCKFDEFYPRCESFCQRLDVLVFCLVNSQFYHCYLHRQATCVYTTTTTHRSLSLYVTDGQTDRQTVAVRQADRKRVILAWRSHLVLVPTVVSDEMQPISRSRGVSLCTALQWSCCGSSCHHRVCYRKTWRHPQNRIYIVITTPPEETEPRLQAALVHEFSGNLKHGYPTSIESGTQVPDF